MPLSRINSASIANSAISAADIADGTITAAKIISVANTQITGNIVSSQITSIGGSQITANTIANSAIQTGAVENYMNAAGLGFGMRNRIINGAMVIDQRNAGAAVSAAGLTLDRWILGLSTTGSVTVQQDSTAPAGFTKSAKVTVTASDTISGTEYVAFRQKIEGFNVADLGWGTASAATVTLSFWVRSSITGTFGGAITNSAQNRIYPYTYTISSANTFEYKTVTIAGDTTGTWLTDNGTGLDVWFGLGVGSTYSGTAGAWSSSFALSATGAASIMGTNGATFYITGVQLEKGSAATSFDYRPYTTELQLCQRYLPAFSASTTTSPLPGMATCLTTGAVLIFNHPVPARVQGTGVGYSSATHFNFSNNDGNTPSTAVSFAAGSINASQLSITIASSRGGTTIPGWIYTNNASAILYITGCEL
jgi:hypothetical protein